MYATRYLKSGFIVDLLGCLPWDNIYKVPPVPPKLEHRFWVSSCVYFDGVAMAFLICLYLFCLDSFGLVIIPSTCCCFCTCIVKLFTFLIGLWEKRGSEVPLMDKVMSGAQSH